MEPRPGSTFFQLSTDVTSRDGAADPVPSALTTRLLDKLQLSPESVVWDLPPPLPGSCSCKTLVCWCLEPPALLRPLPGSPPGFPPCQAESTPSGVFLAYAFSTRP